MYYFFPFFQSVGIICVFLYMITFFLALFSLDQRRMDDKRDGVICCWKRGDEWTPNKCSEVIDPHTRVVGIVTA